MKVLWSGLLFLLFSSLACADAREDYARQIVDSLKIDEAFNAQYAVWEGYEQQLLRTQAEQDSRRATQQTQINKNMLQLSNSLPQHDMHYAKLYKAALQAALLQNFSEDELRAMSHRLSTPRAKKVLGLISDLDKEFTEVQAEAAMHRITGTANSDQPASVLPPL